MALLSFLLWYLSIFINHVLAADNYFAVTPVASGVNNVTGQRPYRKDVNELSGPELHLYLQALQEVQKVVQTDKLSWFQVAGIHGYPPVTWDRVPPYDASTPYPGYAIHNCELFLPWHRAYLLLLENLISRKAIEIAGRYTASLRGTYMAAAINLRLPYWAWEGPTPDLPYLVKTRQVPIVYPNGTQGLITNPIQAYAFHPPLSNRDVVGNSLYANSPETFRQPDSVRQSNYDWVQGNWTQMWPSSRSMVYDQLVSSSTTFRQFAYSSGYSLELIHGNLHNALGGFMYNLYTSSFDPAFYLHHANVDRLWAIWSAIHPNSYMTGGNRCYTSTYAQRSPYDDGPNNPLYPFHKDVRGTFHTPKSVRNVKDLGYAYKEIPDWQFSNPGDLSAYVLGVVQDNFDEEPSFRAADSSSNNNNAPAQRWTIDFSLSVDKDTAATVFFFLGTPPAKRGDWNLNNNLVFAQALLRNQEESVRTASIPITSFLNNAIKQKKLKDLSSTNVEPYLAETLQWKVINQGGSADQNQASERDIVVKVVEKKVVSKPSGLIDLQPGIVHANLTWAMQQQKQKPSPPLILDGAVGPAPKVPVIVLGG